jgi:hypothetical protein
MTNGLTTLFSRNVELRFTLSALLRAIALASLCFWIPYAPIDGPGMVMLGWLGFAFSGAAIGTLFGKAWQAPLPE